MCTCTVYHSLYVNNDLFHILDEKTEARVK